MRAIRVANLSGQELTDQLLFQRAGHCYVKLNRWEDAKVMFLMCSEDFKTAFAHMYLGVACYNLGEFQEAEKVLSLVNYLDPSNAETWAYLALVLLKRDDPPLNAAYQTMNEAIKLGISNASVLHEIALSWLELGQMKQVLEALKSLIKSRISTCTVADKVRYFKSLMMKLKDTTPDDAEIIQNVLRSVKGM